MKKHMYDDYLLDSPQDYEELPPELRDTDEFAEKIPREMLEYAQDRYSDDSSDDDMFSEM